VPLHYVLVMTLVSFPDQPVAATGGSGIILPYNIHTNSSVQDSPCGGGCQVYISALNVFI